jgi:hypothetical protein
MVTISFEEGLWVEVDPYQVIVTDEGAVKAMLKPVPPPPVR